MRCQYLNNISRHCSFLEKEYCPMVVIPLYLTNSRKYCHFGAISPPNRIVGNARLLWVLKRLKRASASSFSLLTPSDNNTIDLRRAASSELLPIQEAWVQIGRKWAVAATGSSSNSRRQQQSKHIDFGDQDSSKQASKQRRRRRRRWRRRQAKRWSIHRGDIASSAAP